jgi:hypothetical protein
MWAEFLPNASIHGFDVVDFTACAGGRICIFRGDQGRREDLEAFARSHGPFDLIIDDGSHASHHQQITLGVLFRHLNAGGLYVIEDLHYQPPELELPGITPTRAFLRSLGCGQRVARLAFAESEFRDFLAGVRSIHFFDSLSARWPLAQTEDALAVIVKKGEHPHFRAEW